MIIRYLKTEKKELEEEAALESFFKLMPSRKQEQEQNRVNRCVNCYLCANFCFHNDLYHLKAMKLSILTINTQKINVK